MLEYYWSDADIHEDVNIIELVRLCQIPQGTKSTDAEYQILFAPLPTRLAFNMHIGQKSIF